VRAFPADMLAPSSDRMPVLSWLERTLLEERQALESALAAHHAVLLSELSPHLQGVERKSPQDDNACISAQQWCSRPVWSEHMQEDDCSQLREEASKATLPPQCVVQGKTQNCQLQPSDEEIDIERMATSRSDTSQTMHSVEVVSLTTSNGHTSDVKSSTSNGHDIKSNQKRKAFARRKTATKSSLQEILSNPDEMADLPTGNGVYARLQRFVKGPVFETVFACLIMLNTLVLALESQYKGIENGWKLGYPGSASQATQAWPGMDAFFVWMEWVFGIIFTVELLMKMVCQKKHFCREVWNFIDTIIVLGWFMTVSFSNFPMPLDPMVLRLARLARLLRLLRLIRKIRLFDSLYLMTTAMRGSSAVLMWSVVLLALVQMMLALFLQSVLEVYILDESKPEAARLEVFRFYGSFARTMLTMFEITLGNWMPPCRALVENVGEWWMLFSLAHKLIIGFSVVSVITAVFIQETFKVATIDDRIMIMSRERANKTHSKKIHELFQLADNNGDGAIDIDEFKFVLGNSELKSWLAAMELDVRDPTQLFALLDKNGNGEIDAKELMEGVSCLRGTARNYDLVGLRQDTMRMMKDLHYIHKQVQEIADKLMLRRHTM